jgi:hypothetical protein
MRYDDLMNIVNRYRNIFFNTKNTKTEYPLYAIMLTYDDAGLVYSSRPCDGSTSKHAEDRLIRNYYSIEKIPEKIRRGQRIKKHDILVIRFNMAGELRNSQPCRDCASKIFNSGIIRKIYYSTSSGHINCVNPKELIQISEPIFNQIVIDYHNGKSKETNNQTKYIISSTRITFINTKKIGRISIKKQEIGKIRSYAQEIGYNPDK